MVDNLNVNGIEEPEEALPSLARVTRQLKYAYETLPKPETAAFAQLADVTRSNRVYAEGIGAALAGLTGDFKKHVEDQSNPHKTNWENLRDKPEKFPPEDHNHDDRYYTEDEIDELLVQYSKVVGDLYLPLAGGTLTGDLAIEQDGGSIVFRDSDAVERAALTSSEFPTDFTINVSDEGGGNTTAYRFNSDFYAKNPESVMRQSDSDLRYLALSGGIMTGDVTLDSSTKIKGTGTAGLSYVSFLQASTTSDRVNFVARTEGAEPSFQVNVKNLGGTLFRSYLFDSISTAMTDNSVMRQIDSDNRYAYAGLGDLLVSKGIITQAELDGTAP